MLKVFRSARDLLNRTAILPGGPAIQSTKARNVRSSFTMVGNRYAKPAHDRNAGEAVDGLPVVADGKIGESAPRSWRASAADSGLRGNI